MDQNLMTIFSGILTLAGSIVTYFISQAAKKHSNVKKYRCISKAGQSGGELGAKKIIQIILKSYLKPLTM
ncbi:hypothetical protein [Lactococcus lactis]|uniref:hypothetical protein n=1 Tax=Lactococcus lactis TaxID=1358 RepID=UPI001F2834B7|nr:hypothetical protein [Lactococcus lactis]